jgi:hypothetical protein
MARALVVDCDAVSVENAPRPVAERLVRLIFPAMMFPVWSPWSVDVPLVAVKLFAVTFPATSSCALVVVPDAPIRT